VAGQKIETKPTPTVRKQVIEECKKYEGTKPFVISSRKINDVVILDLSGDITKQDDINRLKKFIEDLIKNSENKILFNFYNVHKVAPTLTDTVLGVMVETYIQTKRKQGKTKVLHITHCIDDLLFLTKVLTVLDVFDDEQKVLKDFVYDKDDEIRDFLKGNASMKTKMIDEFLTPLIIGDIQKILMEELGATEEQIIPSARLVEDLNVTAGKIKKIITHLESKFKYEHLSVPQEDSEKWKTVNDIYNYVLKFHGISGEQNP
jgi:acyl carrier protein